MAPLSRAYCSRSAVGQFTSANLIFQPKPHANNGIVAAQSATESRMDARGGVSLIRGRLFFDFNSFRRNYAPREFGICIAV